MNPDYFSIFLSVVGTVIMLLMAALIFFLKEIIANTKLVRTAVDELKIVVGEERIKTTLLHEGCVTRHVDITNMLNNHGERIGELEVKIGQPIRRSSAVNKPKK